MRGLSTNMTFCSMRSTAGASGRIATCTASRTSVRASSTTSGASVAEKNSDWRRAGSAAMTLRMSRMKPMSSIRSASSSTKTSTASRRANPCCMRSSSRPGVAMTMSTPRRSACTWGFCPTPPKITVWETPRTWRPYVRTLSPICAASSRVGARISTRGRIGEAAPGCVTRCCRIGSTNAAVLPVPVCAHPSRSRPARRCGIDFACTGVGVVYPSSATARRIGGNSSEKTSPAGAVPCTDGTATAQPSGGEAA